MQRLVYLFLLHLLLRSESKAQVAINSTATPAHSSAMLDVQSNNRGFLPPRMDFSSLRAIPNPAAGLQVYDTTFNCLRYYNGTTWVRVSAEIKEPTSPLGETVLYGDGTGFYANMGDMCADSSANLYTTGWFSQPVQFGNYPLNVTGTQNIFLARYDKNGKVQWARQSTGTSIAVSRHVVMAAGGLYIYGECGAGELTFSGTTVTIPASGALFLARYDVNGSFSWVKTITGTGVLRCGGLAVSTDGNVYLGGNFTSSTVNFATGFSLSNGTGLYDAFIAKYSAGGTVQWIKQLAGNGDDKINDLVWYNNTIAATGYFESASLTLNSFVLANPGSLAQALVAKFDESGTCTYAQHAGTAGVAEIGKVLTVDEAGNLLIAGEFSGGNTSLLGTPLTLSGSTDIFLLRIPVSGATGAWAVQSTATETLVSIAYTPSFVYLSFNSMQPSSIVAAGRTYSLTPRGNSDVFVCRLFAFNPGIAQYQWLQQQGGVSNDIVSTSCADPTGQNVYTGGTCFITPSFFGSLSLVNPGYYIWRYNVEQ